MIEDAGGAVDYEESGSGPIVVLVPGSCSTGAAWRPVIGQWAGRFRCVTTSLAGYGGTAERRPAGDNSIGHEAEVLEAVIRRAGGAAHVVGHSFGGLVALAVALRRRVPLASLTLIEAPAVEALQAAGAAGEYAEFRRMSQTYFSAFAGGDAEAIGTMVDFYGGAGTFASWPPRVRAYAMETTAVNIRDWASAYGFPLDRASVSAIRTPVLVVTGDRSHPAIRRANAIVSDWINGGPPVAIGGAAHFMITTHAQEVARLIAQHVVGTGQGKAGVGEGAAAAERG